jgi:hypothetical protein
VESKFNEISDLKKVFFWLKTGMLRAAKNNKKATAMRCCGFLLNVKF